MDDLTIYNALVGEIEPYSASALTIRKALIDVGITDADNLYSSGDAKKIAIASILVLKKLVVLSSESMGKASDSYNVDMLKERISGICKENGLDESEYVESSSITDGSNLW